MKGNLLLLTVFLVVTCFVFGGVMSALLLAAALFQLVDPFLNGADFRFPGAAWFGVIALAGLSGFAGHAPYDVAKDLWYLSNAVLPILVGYLVMQRMRDLSQVLYAFVIACCIVALLHLQEFVRHPDYLSLPYSEIRSLVSPGYFIMPIGAAIVLGDLKFHLGLLGTRLASWGAFSLCLASVALSFSRTLWLALATSLVIVVVAGNLKKVVQISIVVAMLAAFAWWMAVPALWVDDQEPGSSLIGKIAHSSQELKVMDYDEMADINQNWRGFESYRAIQTYESGSLREYVLGKGFGTGVDLGFVMTLADVDFESIPVLHNGYLYLLVKTGALGLAAYLAFLFHTVVKGVRLLRLPSSQEQFGGLLLIALALVVMETTLVISGLISKGALFQVAILLGILLRYAETRLPEVMHHEPLPLAENSLRQATESGP